MLAVLPELFGGEAAFLRQTNRIAELCRAARTVEGRPGVRLPGEAGLAHKKHALAEGRRCLRAPASRCANAAGGSASSRRRRCNDPPRRCAELSRAAAITGAWVARSRRRRVRRDDGRASTGVCSNKGSSRTGGSRPASKEGRGASAACGPRSRATADRLLHPAGRRNLADVGVRNWTEKPQWDKNVQHCNFVYLLTEQSQY